MSIASRINEMTEHLRNDWNSIDKLGLDITEENSNDNLDKNIKNIAPVLDRFYNHVSDKTDLSENGIVGRTSQDGDPTPENPVEINNLSGDVEYKVRGKNKLPFPYTETSHTHNGITYTINDDGTVLVNGTATAQSNTKLYGNHQEADNKEPIGKYLYGGTNEVRIRALNHTGNSYTVLADDTGNGAEIDTSVYKKYYIEISVLKGATVNNVLIKPMVLDSLDNLKYEPYISESFPLSLGDIELCKIGTYQDRILKSSGKNLFDKNNANVLNGYINASGTITSEVNNRTIYIPCKPNTTYTISKTISQRFSVGTYSSTPQINSTTSNYGGNYTDASITITSGTNDNYLAVWFYNGGLDTKTYQEVIDTLQIEKGTTATSYEPYGKVWYLYKATNKVVLTGSSNENYTYQNNNRFLLTRPFWTNETIPKNPPTGDKQGLFCNYFVEKTRGETWSVRDIIGISYDNPATQGSSFNIACNSVATTESAFKTWLSTHNTEVQYILATPTTTEITQENYPTLYSQLLAIQEFLTKYKINKEFLLDYSSPEIEY